MPHVEQTTQEGIQADVAAAVEHLRGVGCDSVFTVGFCFGGRNSWLAAASGHGLAGAIGFYGRPGPSRDGSPGPTARAAELTAPILALMGGDDPAIPVEEADAFDVALDAARVEHEVVVYPGAPHSFFDRKYEEFANESEDAWSRVLAFLARHAAAS
jgi:carboxymethylenebutenolidase